MSKELSVLRCEKKYILSSFSARGVEHRLRTVLHLDRNNAPGGYLVRSLYFDTIDNTDFQEKIDGYEQRRKIRLRIYSPQAQTAKLELKEKQGDLQRKRSLLLSRAQALQLCAGNYTALLEVDTPLALELYGRITTQLYRPVCIVEYRRTAFLVPENDIRITLDRRLSASEANLNLFDPRLLSYPVAPVDSLTLEVKYNGFLLSYVKDLLGTHGVTQTSASKYCAARSIGLRMED